MNNRNRLFAMGLSLFALCTPVLAADTIESVEKSIVEKWSAVKSMSAKIAMDMNMMGGTMKGNGTVEFMQKDGKEMFRNEMTVEGTMGGQQIKSVTSSILDGEFAYTVSESMGMKQAMKTKPEEFQGAPGGKMMFTSLRKDNKLSLLADEKVADKDHWVIEAKPNNPNPMMSAAKFFFSKETGLLTKMVSLDPQNKEIMSMTYSDVKLNSEIPADRFVFKAPEGVEVQDMTKGMPGMGAPAGEKPAGEKPAGH